MRTPPHRKASRCQMATLCRDTTSKNPVNGNQRRTDSLNIWKCARGLLVYIGMTRRCKGNRIGSPVSKAPEEARSKSDLVWRIWCLDDSTTETCMSRCRKALGTRCTIEYAFSLLRVDAMASRLRTCTWPTY